MKQPHNHTTTTIEGIINIAAQPHSHTTAGLKLEKSK